MNNPKFNIWYLSGLLVAMMALLVRYVSILIVELTEELLASAYEIQESSCKFNI